ncbi:hypothetical protein [Pseudophaeobacter sp.]|uniref:hypothetical protein n=2 Tax=Pseudophaeobacter sp. TaxID=1971739 RepID=UPI0032979829
MNHWEMSQVAHMCERALGMTVRQVTDPDEVKEILARMEKGFLSPVLDPAKNDFTPANSFWLVGERGGEPVLAGGVRLDDLRHLDVRSYWGRMLERTFEQAPVPHRATFPSDLLFGKVAYFGDLLSRGSAGLGKGGRDKLRLFTGIGHYLTQAEFSPDVTYCFLRDQDVMRGTHNVYGFMEICPFMYRWDSDPYPSGFPEWIACTRQGQFPQLMESLRRFTEESAHNN